MSKQLKVTKNICLLLKNNPYLYELTQQNISNDVHCTIECQMAGLPLTFTFHSSEKNLT